MTASRMAGTVEAYRRRVHQIRRQAAAHLGYDSPHLVPPLSLVEHLMNRKFASEELVFKTRRKDPRKDEVRILLGQAITKATWRQYKAALLFVLLEERQEAFDGVVIEELDMAIATLRDERQSGCLRTSRNTSGRKQKAFADEDFQTIVEYLQSRIGKHCRAVSLLTWLRAARIVGVRPSEWRSVGLIEVNGRRAIRFGNMKTTNGRGNGAVRTLVLDQASEEDIEHLDDMIYMLAEQDKQSGFDFDHELKLLSKYMLFVTRRCLGQRSRYPTLYSLRHQFAADAKLSHTPAEVAALMGHGSDATAAAHYGRRTAGQRAVKVSPVPSQVATVRQSRKAASRQLRSAPDLR
jgi:integrase